MSAITGAVEGVLDEVVLRRLAEHVGLELGEVYGRRGKDDLKKNLAAYNALAAEYNVVVLRDLDHDAPCAPELRDALLPHPAGLMHLRVAVREVEAWIMADRATLGRYLKIAAAHMPTDPESLNYPKRDLIKACEHSTSAEIRRGMIPRGRSGRDEGDEYTSLLAEFVVERWRVDDAAKGSNSLARCLAKLRAIKAACK